MKQNFVLAGKEIIAFILAFIAGIQPAIFALGFLIVIDTVLGIWVAHRKGGMKSITSRKLGRVIVKMILYPLALIVALVTENYLAPGVPLTKVAAGIIGIVEFKSIYEKISMLLGFDLWQKIKKAIWKDKEVTIKKD